MRITLGEDVGRLPEQWNVTAVEIAASFPCDRFVAGPVRRLTRGIDVDAPAAVVYRWLCQLRVAPYSYDWIDNLGRQSPRVLTPGAGNLAVGQRFLIARIDEFARDDHISGRAMPVAARLFGVAAVTYRVRSHSPQTSRLVVRLLTHEPSTRVQRIRCWLLGWGDLIMMRKQLRTLKALAEQASPVSTPATG